MRLETQFCQGSVRGIILHLIPHLTCILMGKIILSFHPSFKPLKLSLCNYVSFHFIKEDVNPKWKEIFLASLSIINFFIHDKKWLILLLKPLIDSLWFSRLYFRIDGHFPSWVSALVSPSWNCSDKHNDSRKSSWCFIGIFCFITSTMSVIEIPVEVFEVVTL